MAALRTALDPTYDRLIALSIIHALRREHLGENPPDPESPARKTLNKAFHESLRLALGIKMTDTVMRRYTEGTENIPDEWWPLLLRYGKARLGPRWMAALLAGRDDPVLHERVPDRDLQPSDNGVD